MQITKENYFSKEANMEYMGSTQFKGFISCEAKAMAMLKEDWIFQPSDAMLQGSYIHAWNEGPEALEKFKDEHPEMYSSRGATKGELKSTFQKCLECIEVIKKDTLFMQSLAGEKEVYFTAEMFGCKWKILIDSYHREFKRFADLKALKSLYGKFWNEDIKLYQNVFEEFGYFFQTAIYAEVERLANGREEGDYFEPFISVITKEDYPDKAIINFGDKEEINTFTQEKLEFIKFKMPRILDVKSGKSDPLRCETCDYCRSTKVLRAARNYREFDLY